MPRRKVSDLQLKSVWDESLLSSVVTIPRHRNKLWHHLIYSFSTDQPKKLTAKSTSLEDVPYADWQFGRKSIEEIQKNYTLFTTTVVKRFDSARGDTTKLLVRLQDGHEVETVIMRHVTHNTVCISSQIGCQMGCKFCATGTMGIIGDLTAGEIIEQVVHANNIAKVRNVVFMGMGEPLNNYENMKLAVEFFTDSKRFSLSNRHVTVSTVGVLKNMYRLSDDMPYVNLALSLHAPNQEVRLKIVPTARAVSIEKLMEAVDYHILKNSQFIESIPTKNGVPEEKSSQPIQMDGSWKVAKSTGIMIEYILIRDVNDLSEHAHELAQLLLPRRGYVMLNLIPYNPTEVAEDFHPPSQEQVDTFAKICMSPPYCIHTRVRQEKGQDIAGACGQLAVVNKRAEEKKLEDMEDSMIAASAAVPSRSASSSPDSQCSDHSNGECCNDSKGCRGSGKQKATPKAFPLGKTNGAAVGLKSTFLEGSNGSDSDKSQSSSNQMGDIVNVRSILAHRPALLMYTNIFVALALSFLSFRKK